MYSRRKGKSGSTKLAKRTPSWSAYKGKDVEKLVIKYAKAGKDPSEIGMILRDTYGIHSVQILTGKSITAITEENKLSKKLPEDLINLIKKMIAINQHLEKNKHDQTAKRGLLLTGSKIRRITKYYKSTKRLDAGWKLDTEKLKMYIE